MPIYLFVMVIGLSRVQFGLLSYEVINEFRFV